MYKNPPEAGDILPAHEAIEMIPRVDLGPPIEVPTIPSENLSEYHDDERTWLHTEIKRLAKERNALILAHNYTPKDVQDAAHFIGDSLYLAKLGAESNADVLVEASVLFMNEILAIKKKSHQIVLAPDLGALCSLAAHAKVEKIREWKENHPTGIVVSYVNTYIDVKAESDYCCASANAPKVIEYVSENEYGKPILFLPDVHLGLYAAKLLQQMNKPIDKLWLMMGACHVHDMIRPGHITKLRFQYPNAAAVIHPECGCTSACMRQVSDGTIAPQMMQFRSTWGMIDAVKASPAKDIIVATEVGNLYPMSRAVPEKNFIPANPEAVCQFMKQNTLRNLYESLRDMKYKITVDSELAEKARRPIERMLQIT